MTDRKTLATYSYLTLLKVMLLLVIAGCTSDTSNDGEALAMGSITEPLVKRDLEDIKKDGVLNVIAIYNSTSYFLYKGEPMGFEYELLSRMAKDLGVELRIKIAKNIDELFDMLNRGEGDLIAYGLSITNARKKVVHFTEHHYVTHQVLVQRKPKNWRSMPIHRIKNKLITDPLELIDETVYVRKNSSYYERLQNLMEEMGGTIHVRPMDGNKTTEEIIKMVVDEDIKYTISDYNIASINQTYYPILDIETPVSFSQRIAWAARKNSPELLQEVNAWITKAKKREFYHVIYNKYFRNKKSYKRRIKSDFFSKNSGKISIYDDMIRQNAERINWDWRLLSSLIYQESRFDPNDTAWTGAGGLMQLLPSTAKELGLKEINDPFSNILAGTTYLEKLWGNWEGIPDSLQRLKFVMASYNCGLGHVRDAQRLAEAFEADPLIWDSNVEEYLLMLASPKYFTNPVVRYGFVRGQEPYLYVKEIFLRYDHYRQFIPLEPIQEDQEIIKLASVP